MNVIRAKTAGFCMGVSLALQTLDSTLHEKNRICTLGPIIHNPQVLAAYEAQGVVCVRDASQLRSGDRVIIRAHGLPLQDEAAARARGAIVVDATCPRVKKAQLSIARATRHGASLLLFGEAEHPEVRGLISYTHATAHVFSNREELEPLCFGTRPHCVLASQTTQDCNTFIQLERILRARFPDLVVLSTICDATSSRQEEARAIAANVDVMVVVGGRQSGNTRRLVDVAALSGIETFLVESADELDAKKFLQKTRVGLTAGASTPKSLIDATELWLTSL
ncbi:4-hydroxy-3-methylbut-2-enyl diphosphate reductase [Deltaproteobacteria bacterium]|nr:4-hydroxy-3-methylbut-2-enyl diphosphate reductase [Deltaproteobacteria bacterium]GHU99885.1 4-hydroxy-3-methylbut-2-enyl diphosphate reductase [Deltaproteobacteria bacterium]